MTHPGPSHPGPAGPAPPPVPPPRFTWEADALDGCLIAVGATLSLAVALLASTIAGALT